jgi:hypothetical protein
MTGLILVGLINEIKDFMQNTINVSTGGEYSFQVIDSKTGNVVKDKKIL